MPYISKRTIIILALVAGLAALGAGLYFFFFKKAAVEEEAKGIYRRYDFQDEVKKSVAEMDALKKAEIISGIETEENVVAITFDGVSSVDVMEKVINMTGEYGVKGTFFLQGIEVAEYPRFVSEIREHGNEVGSYTLYGRDHMDQLPARDMIEDFVYSAGLIEQAAGIKPIYLRCNNSRYTDELLAAAAASGYDYVVESTHILNYQSFSNYEMTYNYINRLPKGAVVSIKMKGVLEADEFVPGEKKQEVGKEAGVTEHAEEQPLQNEEERLLQVVEWVLKAVKETERNPVYVKELPSIPTLPELSAEQGDSETTQSPSVFPPSTTSIILGHGPAKPPEPEPEPEQETETEPGTELPGAPEEPADQNGAQPVVLSAEDRESLTAIFERLRGEQEERTKSADESDVAIDNTDVSDYTVTPDNGQEDKARTTDKALTYIFYGIVNEATLTDVLARLEKLNDTGIFFVSDEDATRYPERVEAILAGGNKIGIALLPKNSATALDAGVSLLNTHKILTESFELDTRIAMVPFGAVSDQAREAIDVMGMKLLDYDVAVVRTADEFETAGDVVINRVFGSSMDSLKWGDTVYFRLDFYKSSNSLAGEVYEKIAERESVLSGIESLRTANGGRLAQQINLAYTSERALAFTFYGISGETALRDVLMRLKAMKSTATFYVSDDDISLYPDRVKAILAAGHEIGIALLSKNCGSFEDAAASLISADRVLTRQFETKALTVKVPFGQITDAAKEAVSAMGMDLVGHSINVARSDDEFETSVGNVLRNALGTWRDSLRRGEIVALRLDFYKESDTLTGELIQQIKRRYVDNLRYKFDEAGDSVYEIKGVGALLNDNKQLLYQYPLPKESIPANVANLVRPGYLKGKPDDAAFETMRSHYIGNPDVSSHTLLPGFTEEQIQALDKEGKIDTRGKNVIFLTFDDWASDLRGNHLLHVLEKHNVKASFFIRTNFVPDNPNLLRAIAADGHDLGSHTVNHVTLANYDDEAKTYTSITPKEAEVLETELTESYKTMLEIAGDITNDNGFPTVSRFFRAPTLAQSYIGLRTVLDCGYKYSISGDFSSGDYGAKSVDALMDILLNGMDISGSDEKRTIGPGSIVVMHISPNASHTAEALDLFFTENAKKPPEERFYFARLSDYLGR